MKILTAAAWLCMSCALAAQSFRLDSIQYDSFAGLVQLRWESQPGKIYSLHTSTNLTTWDELRSGTGPLRILAASGGRSQIELAVPAGNRRFWQLGTRPITALDTLTPDSSYYPDLNDVNESSRVAGAYRKRDYTTIGFTWAPGEEVHSFGPLSYAAAVNSAGTVVGYRIGSGGILDSKFFSWTKSGGLVELGNGTAVDINEAGHILGRDASGSFLWKPGTGKIRIPQLNSIMALSDAGHVVGNASAAGTDYRGFLWTETGGLVDLTGGLSSARSDVTDVNSSGQVVGYRVIADGSSRAFSWTAAGGVVTFPANCYITDVSENGKVIGRDYRVGNQAHAFSWTQAGGIIDLGDGMPEKVNELGQIVGYSGTAAVVWPPGGGRTELEVLSAQQSTANLINNNGVVFGISQLPNTLARNVVMWTTNPTP